MSEPASDSGRPGWKLTVVGGIIATTAFGGFCSDFYARKKREKQKRQRVFKRNVRAYLTEFDAELNAHQTRQSKALIPFQGMGHPGQLRNQRFPSERSLSLDLNELPLVLTQSFRASNLFTDGDIAEHKTIQLIGIIPGDRKLIIRRGASEENIRNAIYRSLKLHRDEMVSVTYESSTAGLSYELIVDCGTYYVKREHNVRIRRQTMISQGIELTGFRYSVGVDWSEVSNMLRKAIAYGETTEVINQLKDLLSKNLIERLIDFEKSPDDERYCIGKGLDDIDRDLSFLSCILSVPRNDVLRNEFSRLVQLLDTHIRNRNRTGYKNLYELLKRSYLQKENLIWNMTSWLLSAGAGILQPTVRELHVQFCKDVAGVQGWSDVIKLIQIAGTAMGYTACVNVMKQASRDIHQKQTTQTVQILRTESSLLMAKADQVFLDSHDVEDLLSTLDSDVSNIGLLLRYARGWLIDFSTIIGSIRIVYTTCRATCGWSTFLSAMIGVVLSNLLVFIKTRTSQYLDHIPEEEDDVQEFAVGSQISYRGHDIHIRDTEHASITIEAGDGGEVTVTDGNGNLTCKFAAGTVTIPESNVQLVEQESWGTIVGAPDIEFDEVWEPDSFYVTRLFGKATETVQIALATRDLQMKKQSEFVFLPSLVSDFIDASSQYLPRILMMIASLLFVHDRSEIGCLSVKLLLLESEAMSAAASMSTMKSEIKSLVHDCFVGARRTLHLLGYQPAIEGSGTLKPSKESCQGRIEFKDVIFAYQSNPRPVLFKLNLTIEPGQHVAIVGPSGCGKTSLFSILSRVYDVQSGSILYDNIDIREYEVDHYRQKLLNIVTQEPHIFESASLQYNIKYRNPQASRAEVDEALKTAAIDTLIARLPEKLLTTMGHGVKVSGGEKKRLGLARALLLKSRVLLLDEPTAGLDAATEKIVRQNLDRYRKEYNITVITISHSLSFIQDCDTIVVMGDPEDSTRGTIVAKGTHDHLLRTCESYGKLADAYKLRTCSTDDCDDQSDSVVPFRYPSASDSASPRNQTVGAADLDD